jgi:hypothetical protein
MAFLQPYSTIRLYVIQAIAILLVIVSFLISMPALCDITLGLGWGYGWVTPVVALVQIAIGLTIRQIAAIALKRIR